MTARTLAILLAALIGSGCILAEITPLDAAYRVPTYGTGDSWHVRGVAVPHGGEARALGVRDVMDARGEPVPALEVAVHGFIGAGNDTVARLAFPLSERALRVVNVTPKAEGPYYDAMHVGETTAFYLGMPFLHFLWAGEVLRAGDASEARFGAAVAHSIVESADATGARVRVTLALEARHLDSVLRAWNETLDVRFQGDSVTYAVAGAPGAMLAEFRVLSSAGHPVPWEPNAVPRPDLRGHVPCAPRLADGAGGPAFTLAKADETARSTEAFEGWSRGRAAFLESADHTTGRFVALTDAALGAPTWLLTYAIAGEADRLVVSVQAARAGADAQPFAMDARVHQADAAAPTSERPRECLPLGTLATADAGIPLSDAGWGVFRLDEAAGEAVVPAAAPAHSAHATAATWKVIVPAGDGLQRTLVLSAVTGVRISDSVQPAPRFG